METFSFCFLETQKSLLLLLTLVGMSQWRQKELNGCTAAHQTDEGMFTKGGRGHRSDPALSPYHPRTLLNASVLARLYFPFAFSTFYKEPQFPYRGKMQKGNRCFCKPEAKKMGNKEHQ